MGITQGKRLISWISIIYCAKLLVSQMLQPGGLFLEIKHLPGIFCNLTQASRPNIILSDPELSNGCQARLTGFYTYVNFRKFQMHLYTLYCAYS